eukprot:m.83399 g.83399  ORF g.83399 m.83399 type:complete len:2577 (+) comp12920_c0_seq6:63-7793(+)
MAEERPATPPPTSQSGSQHSPSAINIETTPQRRRPRLTPYRSLPQHSPPVHQRSRSGSDPSSPTVARGGFGMSRRSSYTTARPSGIARSNSRRLSTRRQSAAAEPEELEAMQQALALSRIATRKRRETLLSSCRKHIKQQQSQQHQQQNTQHSDPSNFTSETTDLTLDSNKLNACKRIVEHLNGLSKNEPRAEWHPSQAVLTFLKDVFPPANSDYPVITEAANAYGLIITRVKDSSETGGQLIKNLIRSAFEWMHLPVRSGKSSYCAMVLLNQIAQKSPLQFYENVIRGGFFDELFSKFLDALKSSNNNLREATAALMSECVRLIGERQGAQGRHASNWYQGLLKRITRPEKEDRDNKDSMHGSLLAIGVLTQHKSILKREDLLEIANYVLVCLKIKSSSFASALYQILPNLMLEFARTQGFVEKTGQSEAARAAMVQRELAACKDLFQEGILYLRRALSKDRQRHRPLHAYVDFVRASLELVRAAALSSATQDGSQSALDGFHESFAVAKKLLLDKKSADTEAVFHFFSKVALVYDSIEFTTYQENFEEMLKGVLDDILSTELSHPLVACLQDCVLHVEPLQDIISNKLMELINSVIEKSRNDKDDKSSNTVCIAMYVLANFPLKTVGDKQRETLSEKIVPYLYHSAPSVRESTGLACLNLLLPSVQIDVLCDVLKLPQDWMDVEPNIDSFLHKLSDSVGNSRTKYKAICHILRLAIKDESPLVRISFLNELDHAMFDDVLVDPKLSGFYRHALNDKQIEVRLTMISLLGRIHRRHPNLTSILMQFLTQLLDRIKATPVHLLDRWDVQQLYAITQHCPHFARANGDAILAVVVPWCDIPGHKYTPDMILTIANVSNFKPQGIPHTYFENLTSIINSDSLDTSRSISAIMALSNLKTFGEKLCNAKLMESLDTLCQTQLDKTTRLLVIRVIGALGAPVLNSKRLGDTQNGKGAVGMSLTSTTTTAMTSQLNETVPQNIFKDYSLPPNEIQKYMGSDDYLEVSAINALIRVACDNSIKSQAVYLMTLEIIVDIVRTFHFEDKEIKYLERILSVSVLMTKATRDYGGEDWLKMVNKMVALIDIVGAALEPGADILVKFVTDMWVPCREFIDMVQALADALGQKFAVFLPAVLPHLRQTILEDNDIQRARTVMVLGLLATLGPSLSSWEHMIAPCVGALVGDSSLPVNVRKNAISTLISLSGCLRFNELAGSLAVTALSLLDNVDLQDDALTLLVMLVHHMGFSFIEHGFHDISVPAMAKNKMQSSDYTRLVLAAANQSSLQAPEKKSARRRRFVSDWAPMQECITYQNELEHLWEVDPADTDWSEWIKRFRQGLLEQSTSRALRACLPLAKVNNNFAMELLQPAFISCWAELTYSAQENLLNLMERSLENAAAGTNEIKRILLDLTEFMDLMHKGPLPLKMDLLVSCAREFKLYAKALRYKEAAFIEKLSVMSDTFIDGGFDHARRRSRSSSVSSDEVSMAVAYEQSDTNVQRSRRDSRYKREDLVTTIADLVEMNNMLGLSEVAMGYDQWMRNISAIRNELDTMEPEIDEKLGRFREAQMKYERKTPTLDYTLGRLRCMTEQHKVKEMLLVVKDAIDNSSLALTKEDIASMADMVLWEATKFAEWDYIEEALQYVPKQESYLFQAMLAVHKGSFRLARTYISQVWEKMSETITGMPAINTRMGLTLFLLVELSECISYKLAPADSPEREQILELWEKRLKGLPQKPTEWLVVLGTRSLAVTEMESVNSYIKLTQICYKNDRSWLGEEYMEILRKGNRTATVRGQPQNHFIKLAEAEHLWQRKDPKQKLVAYEALKSLVEQLPSSEHDKQTGINSLFLEPRTPVTNAAFESKCHMYLGKWQLSLADQDNLNIVSNGMFQEIENSFRKATELDKTSYSAHRSWAMFQFRLSMKEFAESDSQGQGEGVQFAASAITGLFKCINLSDGNQLLQDVLHILRVWFYWGESDDVIQALNWGRSVINVDSWLPLIPQLVARINVMESRVRNSIFLLLLDIGHEHPQALVFPLLVAARSEVKEREDGALWLLSKMRDHSPEIINQAEFVACGLIRAGVLWSEQWHTALQKSSALFYDRQDVEGMHRLLQPLYAKLHNPATTLEIAFQQKYGSDLLKAEKLLKKCIATQDVRVGFAAWNYYYSIYHRIARTFKLSTSIDLHLASPELVRPQNWKLAMPGKYFGLPDFVVISSFMPKLDVIVSKQRPRILQIRGNDGNTYKYLLKGQEDPRLDERVMTLFGLINTMLADNAETAKRELRIIRYSITTLSPSAGLIEWVSDCVTLHEIVKKYREDNKITLYAEHQVIRSKAFVTLDGNGRPTDTGYDHLTVPQKVELFEHACSTTKANDIAASLWLRSPNAETWLQRRNNFTRSLAVTSMVGYILGLGDRHPSNIMMRTESGFILHIDFDDCFEVTKTRDQYPENVPFRLTRMLIEAMGVIRIEGMYRWTCEQVMGVIRDDPDSLMAILEMFVHDPLGNKGHQINQDGVESVTEEKMPLMETSAVLRESDLVAFAKKAVARVQAKLEGKDFVKSGDKPLNVQTQVRKLIEEATASENLCQLFSGWCPYW